MLTAEQIEQTRGQVKDLINTIIRDEESKLIDRIYSRMQAEANVPEPKAEGAGNIQNRKPIRVDPMIQDHFPFEILLSNDKTQVYVKHGAFVWFDDDGERQFAATNENNTESAYTLYDINTYALGEIDIYARLDRSSTPVATLATEALSDDPDHISIRIGKVTAGGGIQQYIHDHIILGGSGDQLNHSWLPVKTSDTQFSITKGRVRVGKEVAATALPETATVLTIGTNYYIEIDWYDTYFRNPQVTWKTGTAPANTDTKRNYQIIEFVGGTAWENLVRRQTSDLHVPNYPIPEIPSATASAVLVWNHVDKELQWVSASQDYAVLQRNVDDEIVFDYVRVMA